MNSKIFLVAFAIVATRFGLSANALALAQRTTGGGISTDFPYWDEMTTSITIRYIYYVLELY